MPKPYVYPANSEITWTAPWIGLLADDQPAQPNAWIAFRHAVELAAPPASVPCHIGADSKYWLWINGELAVYEGGLKRGPSPEDTYFDTVDIGPWLRPGTNHICLLLWYFGKSGFCHKDSGRAGVVLQADAGGDAITTSADWRCTVHPAYGVTGEPHPNRRLPEANIHFDAQQDMADWTTADFDDSAWSRAVAYEVPPAGPWGRLLRRPIPQWRIAELSDYTTVTLPPEADGGMAVTTLPYNAQVTPWLDVTAPAGLTIEIRMDNYVGGSENNVRCEYVTRAGRQQFEALGWMNGHAMHYTLPPGVTVHALKYRESGYDCEFSGRLATDDPFLNRLHEKAIRTLYITMRDTYMDCPDRERSQWWGDVVNEMGEAFYALDTRSHALTRKGMYELINWQRDNHVIFAPVPSDGSCGELPMQMLASVGRFGFWTYYRYTAERQVMADLYDGVARYLALWKVGDDGLVIPRKGDWTWGDWGTNKDMNAMFNMWFVIAKQGQAAMAQLIGREADATAATREAETVAAQVNARYWTGTAYRSPEHDGETDDRAQALAVVSGIAGPERYDAIRAVLATEYHASPYMEKYVLEALYQMRFPDDALARMHKRFKKMVDSDYTTLWEGWGIGHEGFGGGTINHAWSGGPVTILNQYAAGVEPAAPGFATYTVRPQLGRLRRLETVVPTVHGEISVSLQRDANRFVLDLHAPAGTVGTIGIPREYATPGLTLRLNGAPRAADGEDAHNHTYRVAAGHWRFELAR